MPNPNEPLTVDDRPDDIGAWPGGAAPLQNVPLTSSDERMHVLVENCWCGPLILASGQGDGFRVEEVDHRGQLKAGDRVAVDDPALARLRQIMVDAGEDAPANDEGVIEEVFADGTILVNFDDGVAAPYPASETRRIDLAERIERDFTYHPPKGTQAERYAMIRAAAKTLAGDIVALTPASREQSLALTNLEQAVMWANASIARNE